MGNINPEIQAFKTAVYGEDVRDAIIDLANKLNAIVEQVVIDTDRDILVGYKNIRPSDYIDPTDNQPKLALVDVAAVFRTNMGDNYFADMPTENAYTIINSQRSPGTNLQIAFGFSTLPNLYWRTVRRDTHEPEMEWVTDNLDVDTTLSVSGAAADAAMVGLALANRVAKSNAYIDQTLTVGSDNSGETKGRSSTRLGDDNVASGRRSVAMGEDTRAESENQVVEGRENIPDPNGVYVHIVGNGTGAGGNKSNAATLDWDGNAWLAGGLELTDTATGTRYRITIENGALKLTALS